MSQIGLQSRWSISFHHSSLPLLVVYAASHSSSTTTMESFVDFSVAEDFPLFEEEGTESPMLMLTAAAPPFDLFLEAFDLSTEMPVPGTGGPQPRVEIPRIRTSSDAGSTRSVGSDKLRATHACTKCRQRKVKCSGERPRCKHCLEFGLECEYVDGKRDRTRKFVAE